MTIEKLEWTVKKGKVSDLINWDKNPRKITEESFERLKDRITKRGFHDVIKTDGHGVILSGNQRKRALQALGIEEVNIMVPNRDLTDTEKDAIAIESNRNDGVWDHDMLANQFDTDFLFELGFNEQELGISTKPEKKDDVIPDLPKEIKSKEGDVYQLGDHLVICGDSTGPIPEIPAGRKIDMVFTDPPYGVGFKYNSHNDKVSDEEYEEFTRKWFTNALRFSPFVVITTGHKHKRMWYKIDNTCEELVWVKKNGQSPGFVSYLLKTEPILVYGKTPQAKYGMDLFEVLLNYEEKIEHTCPKPVELVVELVKPQTERGGTVLDLFLGSGTTLIACEKIGRQCIGVEQDPKYIDTIIQRWVNFTGIEEILKNGEKMTWKKNVVL